MSGPPTRNSIAVGLFVLLGVVLLAGGILTIGDLRETFGSKIVVHTRFEDVGGLKEGANVWFSGVKVGLVREIRLSEDSQVEVDLAVDKKATPFIPADCLTKVGSDALLGNKIVVLYGGTSESPLARDAILEAGDVTSTDDMLAMLQQNNENLLAVTTELRKITADLAEGRGTVGKLLTDEALYDDLRAGAATFGAASGSARDAADELGTFAAKLNQEGNLPNSLVTDKETYTAIAEGAKNLKAVSERASSLVAALDDATKNPETPVGAALQDKEAATDLRSTLHNLDEGSRLLAEDLEALQHSLLLRHWFKKREEEEAQKKAPPKDAKKP